jgi:EAL domain-containing protein (putative c-di-GMP-specific phosphodiesterase class I)
MVASAITSARVPPELVCIEVTESALADASAAARALDRLKEVGVRVAIDDFGTGYSSLSRLHRFPLDLLKIDRSFVEQIGNGGGGTVIVAAVVGLGRALNLRTVAEGIELPLQAQRLQRLGCHAGQGFFWSPAVPAHEALAVVRAGGLDPAGKLVAVESPSVVAAVGSSAG